MFRSRAKLSDIRLWSKTRSFVSCAALLCTVALAGCALQKSDPSSPVLNSIAVAPNPAPSIAKGLTLQFAAAGHYSDGSTADLTGSVAWNSTNPGAVAVAPSGVATGVAIGSAVISATFNGVAAPTVALAVTSPVLQSISVTPNPAPSIAAGVTEQFTATAHYSDGTTANITNTATWNSTNTAFATINSAGLATGVAAGSVTITAASNGVTSSPGIMLTVTGATLQSIAVTPNPAPSIAAGLTEQFTATGHYSDGSSADITSTATWHSTNTAFASINAAGLATGVSAGSITITAASNGVTSSPGVMLTVTSATLQSITVTPNPASSIAAGLTEQFTATGHYSDGSSANITGTAAWNSSNTGFATINSAGLATGVAVGGTGITAALNGITSSPAVTLTITAAALQSITVTPNPAPSIAAGLTQQFTATGHYSDGSTANISSTAAWHSTNTGFATINSAGLATGVAAGSVTITSALSGITSSPGVTLVITAPTVQSIVVTPNPAPSIADGLTEQFTATGHYSDGSTANITSTVTWTSSNTGFATINSAGLAIGVAAGSTTVTAALNGVTSSPGVTLGVTVAVLQSITVTPNPAPPVGAGLTEQFTATGHYSDGSTADITSTATWHSTNTGFASINSAGLATGVATGSTTITAALNGITSSPGVSLSVTGATLQSIVVTPNPAPSIAAGLTEQFTATGHYSDSSTANITSSVTWNSSNAGFATINSAGLATGVATGSTTITAALNGVTSSPGVTLTISVSVGQPVHPLKASANRHYLVDQNNVPFLLVGDSPQVMIGKLTPVQMAVFMADRQLRGFNAIEVMAICANLGGCAANAAAADGTVPFTSGSSPSNFDLSTPNNAYFAELDALINLAAANNLVVFLDPIETSTWLPTLENNGATKAFNFGAYLGNRYKNFPNIVWYSGNDFQSWNSNSNDNNLVYQVMAGIASADLNHLQTIELNYNFSYANQDTATLSSVLTLNQAYTYGGTYDEVLQAYNSSPTLPVFMGEANYEFENDTQGLPGLAGAYVVREQEYWTIASGGVGSFYGNGHTWQFSSDWLSFLDSPGALEMQYLNQLFSSLPWWNLVPDQTHQVTTAGYGSYNANSLNLTQNNYCTTSWVTDGSLAVIYCPSNATLTINMAKFNHPVTATWYDPSNGTSTAVSGSPFSNSGSMQFSSPGNNHDGDPDWVLVLN